MIPHTIINNCLIHTLLLLVIFELDFEVIIGI